MWRCVVYASSDPFVELSCAIGRTGYLVPGLVMGMDNWCLDVRSRALAMGHSRSEFKLVGTPGPENAFWREERVDHHRRRAGPGGHAPIAGPVGSPWC